MTYIERRASPSRYPRASVCVLPEILGVIGRLFGGVMRVHRGYARGNCVKIERNIAARARPHIGGGDTSNREVALRLPHHRKYITAEKSNRRQREASVNQTGIDLD